MTTDAIHRPLTGIGRYAFELFAGLRQHSKVKEIKAFAHGRWVADPLFTSEQAQDSLQERNSLRKKLASSQTAVWAYSKLMPAICGWRLRQNHEALLFSPNYLLPAGPGKKVATFHDTSIHDHPSFHPPSRVSLVMRELPKTLKRVDLLIVVSDFTKARVLEHFDWPEERIHTVHLGVNHAFFNSAKETAASQALKALQIESGHYTLCVATIEPRKNIDRLLAAYRQLPRTVRESCPLVLVGDQGWNSEATHKAIQAAQAEGWVRYAGYLPEDHLAIVMANCALFVFPALYEGFGLPVLEAMACGVPILCADLPSVYEFAGDSIQYMKADAVESMTEALDAALSDRGWLLEAGVLAEIKSRPYSWQRTVDQTVNVLSMVHGS